MMYWKTLAIGVLLGPAVALAQQTGEQGMQDEMQQEMQREMEQAQQPGQEQEFITQQEQDQIVTDNLIGTAVTNQQGEEIGTIQELVVSKDGQVEGVVLGVGGFLGMGEKNVALSWDQIQMEADPQDPEQLRATVDMDRQQLEQAPEFVMRGEQQQQQQ